MSTALVKNAGFNNSAPEAQAPTNNGRERLSQVTVPAMRSEYRLAQSASRLFVLHDDVVSLILNRSGEAIFKLGLTCKYWNLQVREFLTQRPQGQKILREKYEREFRSEHRVSVVNAFRSLSPTSFQKFFDFDDSFVAKECLTELRTSREPVYLVPPSRGQWMTADLKSALASRGRKLTIIEMDAPDEASMHSFIGAIKAVPLNGFVALCISSATLSSASAAEIWGAICSHPVVAHIECTGNNELSLGDKLVELITLLSEKNSNVGSYSLNHCRLDEQSRDALTTLLSESKGINELDVCELISSAENAENLFSAVRARNASAHSKMSLYFTAGNLQDLIDDRESSALTVHGIHIRQPGEHWFVQEDPVEKQQNRDDSSDDDSSTVVGAYSSGDDDYGSEFDTSSDSPHADVKKSSDNES